jgi:exoribonuclease R
VPKRTVRLAVPGPDDRLAARLAALPQELGVVAGFPPDALAEAEKAAAAPQLPDHDATDVELVTLDPPDSRDLDQAFGIEPDGDGWVVHYAIADVAAFVAPGGALDLETRRRGETYYLPDRRISLHPDAIGQDAASLLPDQVRGAFLWRLRLDGGGHLTETVLTRSRVRSRAKLGYPSAQAEVDAGRAGGPLALLPAVGRAREAVERERGGASLQRLETLVERAGDSYRLVRRRPLPIEGWNAQLSLLTGMAAASIMLAGGVGILRTMPPARPEAVERFRLQTVALGLPWPVGEPYGQYLAELDGDDPKQTAILHAAASLFRGAAYTAFDGTPPPDPAQAAIAAPYAHVTAPIRRLVDRFGLLVCLALTEGRRPDDAVLAALPALPAAMAAADALAGRLDRAVLDATEAAVLQPRLGEVFDATVLTARKDGGLIQLEDPAVSADCTGALTPGERIRARLDRADLPSATVSFSRVAGR